MEKISAKDAAKRAEDSVEQILADAVETFVKSVWEQIHEVSGRGGRQTYAGFDGFLADEEIDEDAWETVCKAAADAAKKDLEEQGFKVEFVKKHNWLDIEW